MKKGLLIILLFITTGTMYAQNLYDIDNITLIEIEFTESDWDAIMDQYYANDIDERLVASSFSINGTSYDSVGVKFKGNSTYSADNAKNPLNIKLNYILDQDFQGYKTLKLSNGSKDPSFVREVLSYEIGRKYMDMPFSNYTKITINGDYYGLFSSSEAISGDYLERRFYSDRNNVRFKCNPVSVMGGVSPSLEYLGLDSSLYFDGYELKSDLGWYDLVGFTNQLSYNINNIENYLDVDRALWMLAFNNVIVNLDSYTGPFQQNYYLIKDDNNRFFPIVWDLNQSIGSFSMVTSGGGPGAPSSLTDVTNMDLFLRENDATFPLISKLLGVSRYRKMYVAHSKTILDENFSNNDYYARAQFMQTVIAEEVQNDPNGIYTSAQFSSNMDNSEGGGGGGGPGAQGIYGLSEVMGARTSYLEGLSAITVASSVITNIQTPVNVSPNTSVTITANITNVNYAYLGYRDYVGDIFTKTEMFDDGLHNDGSAGDGVYGVAINMAAQDVQYYIYAENSDAGVFSPVRAEHEFYDLILSADVVINEIMPLNNGVAFDQDGENDDWVEFYNNSNSSVDISGYYLSDEAQNLTKWKIPNGTSIAGNDYLIVWLDNDTLQTGLHANFQMTSEGETIYLSDANGTLQSSVQVPLMEHSTTYGRFPNGTGSFIRMRSTFNAENSFTALTVDELTESINEVQVLVYPNPSTDKVTIEVESNEKMNFYIYDMTGKLVKTGELVHATSFAVSEWHKGIYIIQFLSLNQVSKIIVK